MSESKTNSQQVSPAADTTAAASAQRLQVNVRLQPASASEQPIFSNFAMARGASGTVFIDFGFIEPGALPALARLAQSGGKVPDALEGRLACRVALGLDSAAQLVQQLNHLLQSAAAPAQNPPAPAKTTGK